MTNATITRSTRGTVGNRLTANERHLLQHVGMWGSDSYPTMRVRSRWINAEFFGISLPGTYRTKRAAVAAFETFIHVLVEASGQESYERAIAAEVA